MKLKKEDLVLAALAAGESNKKLTPVQVQKLFFLIDKNVGDKLGGPFFDFEPYHYGPFDKEVYTELSDLEGAELVETSRLQNNLKSFSLTDNGRKKGEEIFAQIPLEMQKYFRELFIFVTRLSFTELVASVYKAYPEMKVNSIFNE